MNCPGRQICLNIQTCYQNQHLKSGITNLTKLLFLCRAIIWSVKSVILNWWRALDRSSELPWKTNVFFLCSMAPLSIYLARELLGVGHNHESFPATFLLSYDLMLHKIASFSLLLLLLLLTPFTFHPFSLSLFSSSYCMCVCVCVLCWIVLTISATQKAMMTKAFEGFERGFSNTHSLTHSLLLSLLRTEFVGAFPLPSSIPFRAQEKIVVVHARPRSRSRRWLEAGSHPTTEKFFFLSARCGQSKDHRLEAKPASSATSSWTLGWPGSVRCRGAQSSSKMRSLPKKPKNTYCMAVVVAAAVTSAAAAAAVVVVVFACHFTWTFVVHVRWQRSSSEVTGRPVRVGGSTSGSVIWMSALRQK